VIQMRKKKEDRETNQEDDATINELKYEDY
jgi:hypothetical protein